MKEGDEALKAVADGAITNKIVLYPQLPDLPLTPLAELPGVTGFSPAADASLRAERWTQTAEEELFEAFLRL
jgi:hypothetical protein